MGKMILRTYGVRGVIPKAGVKTINYGGNTACIGFRVQGMDDIFIFDAGSGLLALGEEISKSEQHHKIHIFLSHTHRDHIEGLPFFLPAFDPANEVTIYGPKTKDGLENDIREYASVKFNPIPTGPLSDHIVFKECEQGQEKTGLLEIADLKIQFMNVNHPLPTLAFRVQVGKVSFTYLTDHEPGQLHKTMFDKTTPEQLEKEILTFISASDLLIADCQYMPDEIKLYSGWGHPSIHYIVNAASTAKVKRLVFTHHDPNRTDKQIDGIVSHYRKILDRKGDGMEIIAGKEVEEYTLYY